MLLYNVKKEEMRIGKHKGKTMYYASPIAQDKITTKQLEDRIVNATALSRADVRSAITALAKSYVKRCSAAEPLTWPTSGHLRLYPTGNAWKRKKPLPPKLSKHHAFSFFPNSKCAIRQKTYSMW